LEIEEIVAFNSILRWGKNKKEKDGGELKDILKNIVPYLRLIFIEPDDLIKNVKPTSKIYTQINNLDIIPKKQYIETMEYLCYKDGLKENELKNPLFIERGGGNISFSIECNYPQNFILSNRNMTVKKKTGKLFIFIKNKRRIYMDKLANLLYEKVKKKMLC
jgi:hypothetical protein